MLFDLRMGYFFGKKSRGSLFLLILMRLRVGLGSLNRWEEALLRSSIAFARSESCLRGRRWGLGLDW